MPDQKPEEKKNPTIIESMGPVSKAQAKRWRRQEKAKQKAIWDGCKEESQPTNPSSPTGGTE